MSNKHHHNYHFRASEDKVVVLGKSKVNAKNPSQVITIFMWFTIEPL